MPYTTWSAEQREIVIDLAEVLGYEFIQGDNILTERWSYMIFDPSGEPLYNPHDNHPTFIWSWEDVPRALPDWIHRETEALKLCIAVQAHYEWELCFASTEEPSPKPQVAFRSRHYNDAYAPAEHIIGESRYLPAEAMTRLAHAALVLHAKPLPGHEWRAVAGVTSLPLDGLFVIHAYGKLFYRMPSRLETYDYLPGLSARAQIMATNNPDSFLLALNRLEGLKTARLPYPLNGAP